MRSIRFAAAALLLLLPGTQAHAEAVGRIIEVQGEVALVHAGASSPAKAGDAVEEHDVIETSDKSRARLLFADETEIVVANHGKFLVDEYAYDAKDAKKGKATFGVFGIAFSYVGGLMEKKSDNVTLNLDFGSIGIRGTKIYRTMRNGECWIYVERGKVNVKNEAGAVKLKSGQGTIMTAKTKAPAPPHIWSDEDIAFIKGSVANPWLHKKDWK